jgi:phosphoribosyl-AMP cyclohydrolase
MIKIRFGKDKLIPAVIQDYKTREVLMVAYMNKKALFKTIKSRKTCFYSRSRKKLWMKGEVSGNVQKVKRIYIDCDEDCILIQVLQVGRASCHTGYRSCFYREMSSGGKLKIIQKKVFDPDIVYPHTNC